MNIGTELHRNLITSIDDRANKQINKQKNKKEVWRRTFSIHLSATEIANIFARRVQDENQWKWRGRWVYDWCFNFQLYSLSERSRQAKFPFDFSEQKLEDGNVSNCWYLTHFTVYREEKYGPFQRVLEIIKWEVRLTVCSGNNCFSIYLSWEIDLFTPYFLHCPRAFWFRTWQMEKS